MNTVQMPESELQQLLHRAYPQLGEKALKEEILQAGKLMRFEAGKARTRVAFEDARTLVTFGKSGLGARIAINLL